MGVYGELPVNRRWLCGVYRRCSLPPGAVRSAVYGAIDRARAVRGTADSSHYTGSPTTRKRFRHRAGASPAPQKIRA